MSIIVLSPSPSCDLQIGLLVVRSSLASEPSQQLSTDEILCQISTFIAAGNTHAFGTAQTKLTAPLGHETTSSALAWTLYALARSPPIQRKLRVSLTALDIHAGSCNVPTPEEFQQILSHPYLDACVREALRLHSPATSTMRVALHEDVIPVSRPFRDKKGHLCGHIRVNKDDIITIPIQAINKSKSIWGDDSEEFVPERWTEGTIMREKERAIKGLWGGILTFGSGHVVNGNRACIGYRFAVNELSFPFVSSAACLTVLIMTSSFSHFQTIQNQDTSLRPPPRYRVLHRPVHRDRKESQVSLFPSQSLVLDFWPCEKLRTDGKTLHSVVTRPCVKSEPHMGNQMPLQLRRVPMDASPRSPQPLS